MSIEKEQYIKDASAANLLAADRYSEPIKKVYIELPFFQNVQIGALICMAGGAQSLQYINQCVDAYNKVAYVDCITRYFPLFGIDEWTLWEFVENENNHADILMNAPTTDLFARFAAYLKSAYEHNYRHNKGDESITLVFNTYPFVMPTELRHAYRDMFKAEFPTLNYQLICKSIQDLDIDWVTSFDVMFVELFTDLAPNDMDNPLTQAYYNKYSWGYKRMYSMPIVDPNMQRMEGATPYTNDTEIMEAQIKTATILSGWSNFKYIKPLIPIDQKDDTT